MTLVIVSAEDRFVRLITRLAGGVADHCCWHKNLKDPVLSKHRAVLVDVDALSPGVWDAVCRQWCQEHPSLDWAFALSLTFPSRDLRIISGLLPVAGGMAYTKSELTSDLVTRMILPRKPNFGIKLQELFLEQLKDRRLIEEHLVLKLLVDAPKIHTIDDWAVEANRNYKQIWRQLAEAGQRAPKELVNAFRLLWAVYLRSSGKDPSKIMVINPRRLSRRLSGSFNLSATNVDCLLLNSVLEVYSTLLVRSVTTAGIITPSRLPTLPEIGVVLRQSNDLIKRA